MTKEIQLTKDQVALVDDDDYPLLSDAKWYAWNRGKYWYALRKADHDGKSVTEYMHRVILNAKPGVQVHHINHDGLDNRRSNLRLVTPKEHGEVRTGRKGPKKQKNLRMSDATRVKLDELTKRYGTQAEAVAVAIHNLWKEELVNKSSSDTFPPFSSS